VTEPPPISPAAPGQQHHLLVQAPVPAVDVDGIRVVTIGTALFAVASVVALLLHPRLAADGRGWWLWVCVCGFGLGLVGLLYCWNRVHQRSSGRGTAAGGDHPL
jgi:hypothetical protein